MAPIIPFAEATYIMLALSATMLGLIILTLPLLLLYEKVRDWYKKKHKRGKVTDENPAEPVKSTTATSSDDDLYEMIECVNRGTQVDICADDEPKSDASKTDATKPNPASSSPLIRSQPASATQSETLTTTWSSMKDMGPDAQESQPSLSLMPSQSQVASNAPSKDKDISKKEQEICGVESFYVRRPYKQESGMSELLIVPERSQAVQTDEKLYKGCQPEKPPEKKKADPCGKCPHTAPPNRYQPTVSSNAIICPRIRAHSNIRQEWCVCPRQNPTPPPARCSNHRTKPKTCGEKSGWSWW